MILLVVLGVVGLALVVYFSIECVRKKKKGAISNYQGRVFYKHVFEINLKNPDGTSRQEIIRRCNRGEELLLVPEPDNRHGPDAVKVCRKNEQQIGYLPTDNGRMAHDLATGWAFRTTIDQIYPFEDNPQKHGVRLCMQVLTEGQDQSGKVRTNHSKPD